MNDGDAIYPLTTADQVIKADGSKLEQDGKIAVDSATKADNAEKLAGKAAEYYIQPRNLLDNSDFTNPVTQRGKRTVSTRYDYPIDRWMFDKSSESLSNAKSTFSTSYHYLVLKNEDTTSGTWAALYHKVPSESLEVGKYTLVLKEHYNTSYINDVSVYIITDEDTVVLPSNIYSPDEDRNVVIQFTLTAKPKTYLLIAIYALPGITVGFDWAALYKGAYTAETLPPYMPKGYAAELSECRRYFYSTMDASEYAFQSLGIVRESGKGEIAIRFPVEMRIAPTMQTAGYFMTLPGFVGIGKDKITVDVIWKNAATLYVEDSSFTTIGDGFLLVGNVASKGQYSRIEFSADL